MTKIVLVVVDVNQPQERRKKMKDPIRYDYVQLVLLVLIVIYGISLLCGLQIPIENKEAFAGVYSVLLTLLSVDSLKSRITNLTENQKGE